MEDCSFVVGSNILQFYLNTNADNNCRNGGGHDVILEFDLQFFAADGASSFS